MATLPFVVSPKSEKFSNRSAVCINAASLISHVNFTYNHNETEITSQNQVNGINPVTDLVISNIENGMPENRFILTLTHKVNNKWQIKTRVNYFGSTIDERAEQEKIEAEYFVDFEVNYGASKRAQYTLGASNLFDTFPNKIETRLANGLPYPRRGVIGYDGGMAYIRFAYYFGN